MTKILLIKHIVRTTYFDFEFLSWLIIISDNLDEKSLNLIWADLKHVYIR